MARRDGSKKRKFRILLIAVAIVAATWGAWGLFYLGPVPAIEIRPERPAIGSEPIQIAVNVSEPGRGIGAVRVSLLQAEREAVIAQHEALHPSPWRPWQKGEPAANLSASVGRGEPEWLEEGEAVLRVTAERFSGPLRRAQTVVEELRFPVRLRPPSISMLSGPVYVRQGGSAAAVFHPGEFTVRSGVVAGSSEFASFPLPGGADGDRLVVFGVPWDLDDPNQIILFAEDDAGNRSVRRVVDGFRRAPPKRDTIRLTDNFLEQVVPAILSQTPKLDRSGSLLEQYLRINGELRTQNRTAVAELSKETAPEFLLNGSFLQLPNSARRASYAEVRTYIYGGRAVDTQTHLGLDLASVARAPVPASNAGAVRFAGYLGIYGNAVVLDHGLGLMSIHAHLSAISVSPGQQVAKGEEIGRTGATGLAGGDHLHLGLFIQGTAVDPIEWLDAKWIANNIADRVPTGSK